MGMNTNGIPATQESMERAMAQLAEMEKFATSPGCRRRAVLSHFGEDMGETRVPVQVARASGRVCFLFSSGGEVYQALDTLG